MTTLGLVIPCKDEYRRLRPGDFLQAVKDNPNLTLLFVDDGSTDRTAETLAFLRKESPAIETIHLPRNVGKAEAVRTGINWLLDHTAVSVVGFWDADLATPFSELPAFLERLESRNGREAVIGVRWPHLGVSIRRSRFRSLTGLMMKSLIRLALGVPAYDTQCGAKIFRRNLAAKVFAEPFLSRWLFDVEVLKRMGTIRLHHAVAELPLSSWTDVPGSKLRLRDTFRLFVDLFRIYRLRPTPF